MGGQTALNCALDMADAGTLGNLFAGQHSLGTWTQVNGRLVAAASTTPALQMLSLGVDALGTHSLLEFSSKFQLSGGQSGFLFDRYGPRRTVTGMLVLATMPVVAVVVVVQAVRRLESFQAHEARGE